MSALLEVSELRAGYGAVRVLHGLDFSVDDGEVVVILGANGAGKTTTLRALSGMIDAGATPSSTARRVLGRRPEQLAAAGIAHVPQGRGTIVDLTVDENLRIGAYRRRDKRDRRPTSTSGTSMFPRLGQRRDQQAGSMSGGEQQMLAIARALMARPKLVLLDEPSLGLAPLVTQELFRTLGGLNRERGRLDAHRRAERQPRARHRGPGLRARDRRDRDVGNRRRARRQRRRTPARTWGCLACWRQRFALLHAGDERHRERRRVRVAGARARADLPHDRHPQLRPGRDGAVLDVPVLVLRRPGPSPSCSRSCSRWCSRSSAARSIERVVIRPVEHSSPLVIVIVTIGLFLALELDRAGAVRLRHQDRTCRASTPRRPGGPGNVQISADTLVLVAVLAIVCVLLYLLFQHTKVGLAMRAVASNARVDRPVRRARRAHAHARVGPGRRARRARPARSSSRNSAAGVVDAVDPRVLVRGRRARRLRQPGRRRRRRHDRRGRPDAHDAVHLCA